MSDYRLTPEQLEAITGASYVKEAPEFRVVRNMPDPVYRKTGGVSGSFLCSMGPTDAHVERFFNNKVTWDMQLGLWIHQGVLPGCPPLPEFAIQPQELEGEKWHGNRTVCKKWTADKKAKGIEVLSADDSAQLFGSMAALSNFEESASMLTNCDAEISLFQRMKVHDVEFMRRGRLDIVPFGKKCIGDLKKVQRGEGCERAVENKIRWDHWGEKAAWYLDLWNDCNPDDQKSQFVWIVVESEAPFSVYLYYLNIDQLAPFRTRIMDRMERAAKCIGDGGLFRGDQSIKQIIL